ncbi:MAG TPA: RcpC/CpaB family pilus assembly protein [Solirubrobacterales bacterium]
MSRRARAVGFGCAALACAGLAAAVAGGYRTDLESELGPLGPAVVAREALPSGRALRPADADRLLDVRRMPARFVPPGALSAPEQAIGRVPAARIPAGAYLLAAQLRAPHANRRPRGPRLAEGREPVQISVTGTEALAATGRDLQGARVDVIVTTEPGLGGGRGRTYVAAEGVELLALSQGADAAGVDLPGPSSATSTATLALTRPEALRLIHAQNFARQVVLIPR